MKTKMFIVLLICFSSFCFSQVKNNITEIYISPVGNDNNVGTEKKPFKTIEKAKGYIRTLSDVKNNIVVYLRGGEYSINKTILFESKDSGKDGANIIYKAYKNEKPIISGGVEVKGWTKLESGIYKARFTGDIFRQLYVNDKKAVRARTPNKGTFYRLKFWDYNHKEVVVDTAQVAKIKDFDKVEMIPHLHWAEQVAHLASIIKVKEYAYITFKNPEQEILYKRDYPIKAENESYHFENALEFLDSPGEWYYDEAEKNIYYMPRKGEDNSKLKAVVPQLETLMKIEGTIDNPVKNIQFYGIQFSHSNWNLPSKTGICFAQAGQYTVNIEGANTQYFKRPESAILLNYVSNIKFERNVFKHLGSTGIDFYNGVSNSSIVGNLFYDISGNGISVAKFSEPNESHVEMFNPKDERVGCSDDTISNNIITETCNDYINTCGVSAGYARGLIVDHNEVYNLPYTGISVGWGWEDKPNFMKNNSIRWNHIYDVMKILCDGGGVYTLSRQPNSDISFNYIHDVYRSVWAVGSLNNGIFLDQGSSGITLKKNVFKNVQEGSVRHNITGELLYIENEYFGNEVMTQSGLIKEYQDIRKLIPVED